MNGFDETDAFTPTETRDAESTEKVPISEAEQTRLRELREARERRKAGGEAGAEEDRVSTLLKTVRNELARRLKAEKQIAELKTQLETERERVEAITGEQDKAYELAARRRKVKFWLFFSLAVAVPTLAAGVYYFAFASNRYVSETTFSVYSDDKNILSAAPALAALGLGDTSNKRDLLVLKAYMESPGMLEKLDSRLKLKELFRRPGADFWERMPEEVSRDEFLKYYLRRAYIELDQDAGVLTYHVDAFRPEDAKAIAAAVLDISEQFINDMMVRIRRDDLKFAGEQLQESESRLAGVLQELNNFRKKNNNLDPTKTGEGLLTIMQGLETERIKASADLAARGKVMTPTSHDIKQLKYKISALTDEIEKQKSKLVGNGADPLSDVMQEYQALLIKQEFLLKRYTITLTSFEAATVASGRKSKYIVRVTEPDAADRSTEPQRFTGTFTVFVVSLLGVSLLTLFSAGVRDHLSA